MPETRYREVPGRGSLRDQSRDRLPAVDRFTTVVKVPGFLSERGEEVGHSRIRTVTRYFEAGRRITGNLGVLPISSVCVGLRPCRSLSVTRETSLSTRTRSSVGVLRPCRSPLGRDTGRSETQQVGHSPIFGPTPVLGDGHRRRNTPSVRL